MQTQAEVSNLHIAIEHFTPVAVAVHVRVFFSGTSVTDIRQRGVTSERVFSYECSLHVDHAETRVRGTLFGSETEVLSARTLSCLQLRVRAMRPVEPIV
ncbi:hypothetical protein RRG08_011613 [Elysia crispata]|uniref:Uncharacterized protein n=1 Tax=Elysia crispata TaxID=231223 RepID=A0AAE1CK60_9GAST|nr:hypothetical protein RRG08_011613 [Elysia crispata]